MMLPASSNCVIDRTRDINSLDSIFNFSLTDSSITTTGPSRASTMRNGGISPLPLLLDSSNFEEYSNF